VRNEPEDTLNVDGSHTVIDANDSAHSPIERCQVVNAEETVTTASELNNGEAELRVDTETSDDDAIKDYMAQDALVSSNDKLHIEQVCKAHKTGEKIYSLSLQSARMSKITNDALTRSDTGFTQIETVGVKGLKLLVPPLTHPTPPLEPPQLQKCRTATG